MSIATLITEEKSANYLYSLLKYFVTKIWKDIFCFISQMSKIQTWTFGPPTILRRLPQSCSPQEPQVKKPSHFTIEKLFNV